MTEKQKTSFDKKAFGRLMRAPTFTPTDCPNFITYRDYNQYRWYARSILPLLWMTGASPYFMGHRLSTLFGESPGETWMVVRYGTHRRMLGMITNPYYFAVANRLRERGTARLELAFTQPRDPASGLHREQHVLGLHAATDNDEAFFDTVGQLAASAGLRVVYESEVRLSLDFVRNPQPRDPNPLTYPTTAAVAGTEAELRTFAADASLVTLLQAQPKACAQLYARAGKYELIRFGKREPASQS